MLINIANYISVFSETTTTTTKKQPVAQITIVADISTELASQKVTLKVNIVCFNYNKHTVHSH